ncbi:hypothetical protein HRbin02_01764 [Candidatus Calditenuaceae archaeon HR02]|nr:hypothetical protein HRbin02_01764 [Candidatus Calditenuaceae archaeon HR02]
MEEVKKLAENLRKVARIHEDQRRRGTSYHLAELNQLFNNHLFPNSLLAK